MNILWDFDGTLFNTYPAYTEILYEILSHTVSKQDIYNHLKISFTHAVQYYDLSEEQVKRLFAMEKAVHPADTTPFPFVEDILKFADLNVIMAHKPRKDVEHILKYYDFEDYFTEIVAIDDGYPRKPDPASYIYLHHKYKIDLVIGDREIDIAPAKSIGIKTCLFQNSAPGADVYLTAYENFFDLTSLAIND